MVVKPAGARPIRIIQTRMLDDIQQYKDKLDSLLNIDDDWFSDHALIPATWYLAQINTGGIIAKYTLNPDQQESARQKLHHMAQQVLKHKTKKERYNDLFRATLFTTVTTAWHSHRYSVLSLYNL